MSAVVVHWLWPRGWGFWDQL
uniref:Uncharacterized protein n=1 Tax=Anguilla anguilla TaxID=7936 RepID=A0A0E9VJD5_ANGAN